MIVKENKSDSVTSGFADSGQFKIKASAKAFRVLSDNIYTDKIGAIIRELGTNAVDAQIDAKTDRPFEVTLPDIFDPTFTLRDYGTGISHDNVMKIYSTYFESTKEDSNDFYGTLGLGSKSPFAYTDTFTVISYFNGVKYNYIAHISDSGTPDILFGGFEVTTEPNGVEVSFPVNKSDFETFAYKAAEMYYWFTIRPVIKGSYKDNVNEIMNKFIDKSAVFSNWFIYKPGDRYGYYSYKQKEANLFNSHAHNTYRGTNFFIKQGPIVYPVMNVKGLNEKQTEILSKNIVYEVPNGTVNFAPSREQLDYNKTTVEAIKNVLDKIYDDIKEHLATEFKGLTPWKATAKFNSLNSELKLRSMVSDKVTFFDGKIDFSGIKTSKVYVFSNGRVSSIRTLTQMDHNTKVVLAAQYNRTNTDLDVLSTEQINDTLKVYTFTNNTAAGVSKFQEMRSLAIKEHIYDNLVDNKITTKQEYTEDCLFVVGKDDEIKEIIKRLGSPDTVSLDGEIKLSKRTKTTAHKYTKLGSIAKPSKEHRIIIKDDIADLSGYYIMQLTLTESYGISGPDIYTYNRIANGARDSGFKTSEFPTEVFIFRKDDETAVKDNTSLKEISVLLDTFKDQESENSKLFALITSHISIGDINRVIAKYDNWLKGKFKKVELTQDQIDFLKQLKSLCVNSANSEYTFYKTYNSYYRYDNDKLTNDYAKGNEMYVTMQKIVDAFEKPYPLSGHFYQDSHRNEYIKLVDEHSVLKKENEELKRALENHNSLNTNERN